MGTSHIALPDIQRGHQAGGIIAGAGNADTLTLGAASVLTAALNPGVYRLSASGNCWYTIGNSGAAAAADADFSAYLEAGRIDFIEIRQDSAADPVNRVACIQEGAATGSLSITRRA